MKKLTHLLIIISICASCNALAQTRLGFRIGYSSSTRTEELRPISSRSSVQGWQAGISTDTQLSKIFFIQSGILFTTKGYTRSSFFEDPTNPNEIPYSLQTIITETAIPYYIEPSVLGIFKAPLNNELKLSVGLGVFARTALGGRVNTEYKGFHVSYPLHIGNNQFYSRNDFGVSGITGITIHDRLQLGLIYDYGLANVSSREVTTVSHSRSVNLTVSLFL